MQNDDLARLVAMVQQTNIISLDKTLQTIRRANTKDRSPNDISPYYVTAAMRVGAIAERICRAAHEVRQTIPGENLRPEIMSAES